MTMEANNQHIKWHNDVLIKQLISYLVGVCMGRYRLDKPGLHIAYPNPSAEDLAAYDYHGKKIVIDDDGIIPLLPHDSPFSDNMINRLATLIGIVFGEDHLTDNLNYMERCLGETLEKYLIKDYWKDHKKMYQNWKDKEELMETVYSLVDQMLYGAENVGGIGVASVGPLDVIEGVIETPPYFNGIHDVPVMQLLKERYGLPVVCDNDNQSAALAATFLGPKTNPLSA